MWRCWRGMKQSIPEWLVRPATEADAPALAELMGELGYPAAATAIPPRVRALGTDRRAMIVVAADPQALGGVITAHHLDSIHDDRPVGLNTPPAVSGLWTRLLKFRREDLCGLLQTRRAVRGTMMRGTIFVTSTRDYVRFRAALQPLLTRGLQSVLRKRLDSFDVDAVVRTARGI